MNEPQREAHQAGNTARDWIGLAAATVALFTIIFIFGGMLP
jgi:hypothetical protein